MKICWLLVLIPVLVLPVAHVFAAGAQRTLIQNRGSDSMAIAVVGWAEQYNYENRTIGLAVSGGGTGTGIASLINGTVDIANASRMMNGREINLAKVNGIAPVQHVVGYDAVAIYVHKDNPLKSLSFSSFSIFMPMVEKQNPGRSFVSLFLVAMTRRSYA